MKNKLDTLKVKNFQKEDKKEIVCQRYNNRFKLLTYGKYNRLFFRYKEVDTRIYFEGKIIEEGDKCSIEGKCKFSKHVVAFIVLFTFIVILMNLIMLKDGFIIFLFEPMELLFLMIIVFTTKKYINTKKFDVYIKNMIKELE